MADCKIKSTACDLLARLSPLLDQICIEGGEFAIECLPGAAEAVLVWVLYGRKSSTIVVVADGPESQETRYQDLITLAPAGCADRLLYFPPAEMRSRQEPACDPEVTGYRLNTLARLAGISEGKRGSERGWVVVTCIQALLQTVVEPEVLRQDVTLAAVGEEFDIEWAVERLINQGYAFEAEVVEKGQVCRRGGLLDVWPLSEVWPLRLELFGSTVESIRTFDPETQRSVGRRDWVVILPAVEKQSLNGRTALDYLPDDAMLLWSDMSSIRYHAGLYEEFLAEAERGRGVSFQALRRIAAVRRHPQIVMETETGGLHQPLRLDLAPLPEAVRLSRELMPPDVLERTRKQMLANLKARAKAGHSVVFFFDTQGALDRFREVVAAEYASGADEAEGWDLRVGVLSGGFVSETGGVVVVAECDLYGRRKRGDRRYDPAGDRPRPRRLTGMRLTDLTDIEPGDLVVHVQHGVGRYLGMNEIMFNGQRQEVLTIEYAEGAKLHVPVSQAHLLSRYVGLSRRSVQLHRLGGRRWQQDKAAAERAIMDLASSLLETQARRSLLPGTAFPPDTPWQHELEASFPYRETADQLAAIADVKRDMESPRPMDRLVCGDAGYGKTEVALRAAFKAVTSGKQASVLVPTTVLAQQHFDTFRERMAAFPVRIEMLSRFRSRRQQAAVLEGLAAGTVDIVIGTHALLQPGVRFKDLGLVIIDEEQRFGVAHKERLKQLRLLVDVLTLTATPIPRTLYMSLTGARDMSLLQTAPSERLAIETIVARSTDKVIREAILRELNREGQVYYVHNRVMTIETVRARLEQIVPEARIRVGHGQMSSRELAAVMRAFAEGEFDVLLCTTIVESGLDIPRANTILIDRADRFGIAELYQLRGRVGRSSRKAYAYLLLPSHGVIDPDARERIAAVKKYSSLGAGFNLALRDLEIRGAGNLLGAEQSGHITAVGFGLYCQLLQRTIARLKGEPLPPLIDVEARLDFLDLSPAAPDPAASAFIPFNYIEDERLRVSAYRRIAEVSTVADLDQLRAEWHDRYGPLPPQVARLLRVAELRIVCTDHGIRAVETRDGRVMLTNDAGLITRGGRFPRLNGGNADEKLEELIALAAESGNWV